MGLYINVGSKPFERALNGEYVDKTGLIAEINGTLCSERQCSCVSRCRRFGKSMAANMLMAYYDCSCDSRHLFSGLEIERHPSFEQHLNKYHVVRLDMTTMIIKSKGEDIVPYMQRVVIKDVLQCHPELVVDGEEDLMEVLWKLVTTTGRQVVMIIDEWDAICRERKDGMDDYVQLLRMLFKGDNTAIVFAGVYMTGILPIKKYATESALNNFWEYSMIKPGRLARFFGFTKGEVQALCEKHGFRLDEMEKWYDGYSIGNEPSMFNPASVMKAIYEGRCSSFWAATGAFTNVAHYIGMNFEGLKDDVVRMLGGGRCNLRPNTFGNDPSVINTKDEVLTLLVHLGYLAYDYDKEQCYIPNKEVAGEMEGAVEANNWHEVIDAIYESRELMYSLLDGEAEAVAEAVERVHQQNTSIIAYNNENALACVLTLAFYAAKDDYIVEREMPRGKGFADLVFIPRRGVETPAIVMELKWKQDVRTALDQIRERDYPDRLRAYAGDILLCGITYDKDTKKHACVIESQC